MHMLWRFQRSTNCLYILKNEVFVERLLFLLLIAVFIP